MAASFTVAVWAIISCTAAFILHPAFGATVGVAYGRVGNNLPSPPQVVSLLQQNGVENVFIYDSDHNVLDAFQGSGIKLIVSARNDELQSLASGSASASTWVQSNILPYASSISIIAVGNEVLTQNSGLSQYLFPAMSNIHNALQAAGLDGSIHVSTPNAMDVIDSSKSFPPSSGAFSTSIQGQMSSILNFLSTTGAPFLANVYPFFAYIGAGGSISLQYALFQQNPGVTDSGSGLHYSNLFDAQVDTLIYAMAASGYGSIPVVVTETGWPHAGDSSATTQNAQAYNSNLVASVPNGTPKRPNQLISTYIFDLFDENQKGGAAYETSFGIFDPSTQTKNYDFSF